MRSTALWKAVLNGGRSTQVLILEVAVDVHHPDAPVAPRQGSDLRRLQEGVDTLDPAEGSSGGERHGDHRVADLPPRGLEGRAGLDGLRR